MFCPNCGSEIPEKTNSGAKIAIIVLSCIIVVLLIVITVFVTIFAVKSKDSNISDDKPVVEATPETDGVDGTDTPTDVVEEKDTAKTLSNEEIADMEAQIIRDITERDDYMDPEYWSPMASADDFNNDGNIDMLLCYFTKTEYESVDALTYSLWTLYPEGAKEIKTDTVYTLVGGNSGEVGIALKDGTTYLSVIQHMPEAEFFQSYYMYNTFTMGGEVTDDGSYYGECSGYFDDEENGKYIVGDSRVSMSDFNTFTDGFTWTVKMDPTSELMEGDVYTFSEFLSR